MVRLSWALAVTQTVPLIGQVVHDGVLCTMAFCARWRFVHEVRRQLERERYSGDLAQQRAEAVLVLQGEPQALPLQGSGSCVAPVNGGPIQPSPTFGAWHAGGRCCR
jgi:hypothetical protein